MSGFYVGAAISVGDRPLRPDEPTPHPLRRLGSGDIVDWLVLDGHDLTGIALQLEHGRQFEERLVVGVRPDGSPDPQVEAGAAALVRLGVQTNQAWRYSDTVVRAICGGAS